MAASPSTIAMNGYVRSPTRYSTSPTSALRSSPCTRSVCSCASESHDERLTATTSNLRRRTRAPRSWLAAHPRQHQRASRRRGGGGGQRVEHVVQRDRVVVGGWVVDEVGPALVLQEDVGDAGPLQEDRLVRRHDVLVARPDHG